MVKQDVIDLVESVHYHKIRAGETHRFIDISIVVAEGRLFCRQYFFSKQSWYHAFQEDPNGTIKCGDKVIKVHGVIPEDLNTINEKVNQAYLDKYGKAANKIVQEEHMDRTMELIPIFD